MNNLTRVGRGISPLSAFLFSAFSFCLLLWPSGAKAVNALKIDLTAGTNRFSVDRTYTYNLGATGMRGWIDNGWPETSAQDGYTAFAPFQILVTAVASGTPAAGNLAVDDVILGAKAGAGAVPLFTNDARKSLGWAIVDAEAGTGVLSLKRWRAGTTTDVSITLPIMGAYSATAPYNCPKTALIMTNAAKALAQRINTYGWGVDGPGSINALALLATGIPDYLPMLQTYARSIAPTNLDLERTGISAWDCYNSIFLAEYYMVTGDAQVFHGLSEYVLYAARHTSMYGTAGHGFANVPPPEGWPLGGTHGSISWYGPVNSAGLVAQLTVALGKKAGVVDPEIDPAIARAANFFGYYVNKGSIPYGEHVPFCGEAGINGRTYWNHRSNGKDGLAAVLYAVMGGRPVQAQYYSRMALAGYNGEPYGHTGQGFSYLWTMLGANVAGTNAVQAYQQKLRWDRDMKRRLDGSFVYEGGEQWAPGRQADYWDASQANGGPNLYYDNPTAYYLIHAAIPLQKLYITGKNADPTNTLSSQVVSNALWAAQYPETCGGYDTNQLVSHLAEYDPLVRMNAATELSLRPGASSLVPLLIALATNPTNASQRAGACYALGVMQATSAVPTLVSLLSDPDYGVRFRAAEALGPWNRQWQGSGIPISATVPYLTSMMATYITNVTPTYPLTYGTNTPGFNWTDPLQFANGMLAVTVFNPNNLGANTINTPKNQLWPAVAAGIKHPTGAFRGNGMNDFVVNLLTLEDVKALALNLFEEAELEGPCDRMYTGCGPDMAMNVLSKYNIFEGVEECMGWTGPWGWPANSAFNYLSTYNEAARRTLPDLMEQNSAWATTGEPNVVNVTNAIVQINGATSAATQVYGRPYAGPQIVVTPVNTARAITLAGSSCRTNQVTYAVATQPGHGVLSGSAPNVTYTPAAGYQGMDRFTFTVTDYITNSTPGTVHIVVGAGGSGLKGQYFDTTNFTPLMATVTNPAVNFDWGTAAPAGGMGADTYSVRWTGQVMAPESGLYRFSTRTSDGVRLWVNGLLVIDDWRDQSANLWNDSVGINLTAGSKYNVKMEYYRNTTPSTVRLYWYMPSRLECAVIPQELLYPVTGVSLTAPANGSGYASASAITLTAEVTGMAGTVTNVGFYSGAALLTNDTTAPYSFVWSNVPGGEYSLTARATDNTGLVSTSAVAVITVDSRSVPVTSGLACWYDASYGVTVDRNQNVRFWRDRSTNGNDAVLHYNDGNPALMQNQLLAKPALRFAPQNSRCWLDVARPMFVKEQYVVARNYTTTPWNYGAFLGRRDTSASSYLLGGTGFEWLPAAVSRNGTVLSSANRFDLSPTTNYMVIKITVDNGNTSAGPYIIGGCNGYYTTRFDVTEILGYSRALTTQEEAQVGGYLAGKYGIATTYPASGSLANWSATGITPNGAALNGLLMCNGTNYGVVAYWGTTDGGLTANWDHSAFVGSWNKVSSTNLSVQVSGLLPGTTCYFTFRATNAVSTGTLWAAPSQSFTTLSTAKDLLSFGVNVAGSSAVIDTGAATVTWTVLYGTVLTNLAPAYTVSALASGSPASGTSRNFSTPQTYTITAQDGSTKVYTVTAALGAPSPACDILTFGPGAVINGTNITWSVPYGTALAALAPAYTVSLGASGVPASGVAPSPNFAIMNPGTYTITAQDGVTTKSYRVAVGLLPYSPAQITNGSFEIGKAMDQGGGAYAQVSLPGTDLPGWSGNFKSWYVYAPGWGFAAQDGTNCVNLVYQTGTGVISQTFNVTANTVYTVSYYERYRGVGGIMDTTLSVAAGTVTGAAGTPVAVSAGPAASIVQKTAMGNAAWTRHTFKFTPNTTTTATISFGNHYGGGQGDNDGVFLDNVSVVPPLVATLINSLATGVDTTSAVLNATLTCTGTNCAVYAHWNTVNGGTNAALWSNSAYVRSWTNVASTNISYTVTNLAPGTTYYFTFRGTNAGGNLWAPNVLNFTTPALPPAITGVSPGSGRTNGGSVVTLTGSNFLSGATVQFGGINATAVAVNSPTQVTAMTPAHGPGAVNVVVSNTNGLSATNQFTYVLPPPPATLGGVGQSGTNLVMVWAGGTNQSCVLLSGTNVTQPRSTWSPVATNAVGSNGLSTNRVPVNPGDPQRYLLLSIPYN